MLDVTSISAIVAACSVAAGVIYYSFNIRHQKKMRETDLVVRLYSIFGSREFQEALMKTMTLEFEDFNDFRKKYASSFDYAETPEFIANEMVSVLFEGIGVLLYRKLVGIELLDDLFTGPIKSTWKKMKPLVQGYRKTMYPQAYEWFEYLFNETQKREQTLPAQQ